MERVSVVRETFSARISARAWETSKPSATAPPTVVALRKPRRESSTGHLLNVGTADESSNDGPEPAGRSTARLPNSRAQGIEAGNACVFLQDRVIVCHEAPPVRDGLNDEH